MRKQKVLFTMDFTQQSTRKVRIAVCLLAVESKQLQIDRHGSDVMATKLSNIILLNSFFVDDRILN